MNEQLQHTVEQVDQLLLKDMRPGDTVKIVTGIDDNAWEYEFTVSDTSRSWPAGTLVATAPDGTISPSIDFELHGAGTWTDRHQNPVQTQQWAFTSYFEHIFLKGIMVGRVVGASDRLIFDKPGQEISQICVRRPN